MEIQEAGQVGVSLLHSLVGTGGRKYTLEVLSLTDDDLDGYLSGVLEMSPDVEHRIQEVHDLLENRSNSLPMGGGLKLRLDDEEPEDDAGSMLSIDLDGDGVADMEIPNLGVITKPHASLSAQAERRRDTLVSAWAVALMTQFRTDMDHQDTVAALGLITEIEVALIMAFRETIPLGREWDPERRARELEKRFARLRWVRKEREREFSGLKGVLNKMRGKRAVTGQELYERMVVETDMIMDMMENQTLGHNLDHVLRGSGLGHLLEP